MSQLSYEISLNCVRSVSKHIPESASLSEAVILERRERAARYLSIEARWDGDVAAATLLERYEKSARYMAECASRGIPLSEAMIQERREMEAYLLERALGEQ